MRTPAKSPGFGYVDASAAAPAAATERPCQLDASNSHCLLHLFVRVLGITQFKLYFGFCQASAKKSLHLRFVSISSRKFQQISFCFNNKSDSFVPGSVHYCVAECIDMSPNVQNYSKMYHVSKCIKMYENVFDTF